MTKLTTLKIIELNTVMKLSMKQLNKNLECNENHTTLKIIEQNKCK